MNVALIDIDKTKFPTLTLMKLSAWHKARGDTVSLISADDYMSNDLFNQYDKAYASCILDWNKPMADKLASVGVTVGGSGYDLNIKLPDEIEHIYPDYSLYDIEDTAYGYLTRGCPRGCPFCIVKDKEGRKSVKVADLSEWWSGQKNIKLLDPNLLACTTSENLLLQLIDSKATIDYTQGLDARLLNERNIELIQQTKYECIHFAWDNPKDKTAPKALEMFKNVIASKKRQYRKHKVYVLTNYWSTHEEDLMRVYWLREHDYDPYIMIYDKPNAPRITRRLQRWVNNKFIFRTVDKFEDYDNKKG